MTLAHATQYQDLLPVIGAYIVFSLWKPSDSSPRISTSAGKCPKSLLCFTRSCLQFCSQHLSVIDGPGEGGGRGIQCFLSRFGVLMRLLIQFRSLAKQGCSISSQNLLYLSLDSILKVYNFELCLSHIFVDGEPTNL